MQELEVSERTIHRMRETLELAGVPLYFSRQDNAYQVRPDFRFPTLHLTEDEALGQATATVFTDGAPLRLKTGAGPVTRKLIETTNEQARRTLEEAGKVVQVLDMKIADNSRHHEVIKTAQWALIKKRMLSGSYRSPYESAPLNLKLVPYRLVLCQQAWYLIAKKTTEEQPRTFRIVRFRSLKLLDQQAEVPNDFDLNGYLGNAWGIYRGEQSYEVELLFLPAASEVVAETTWHPTQKLKKHEDGSLTATFTVDGLREITRWVVGWAGRVRVIRPVELRDLVLEQHRQAIEVNGGKPDDVSKGCP